MLEKTHTLQFYPKEKLHGSVCILETIIIKIRLIATGVDEVELNSALIVYSSVLSTSFRTDSNELQMES